MSKDTTIRFPSRLKTQLRVMAAERGVTMETVIAEVWQQYYERNRVDISAVIPSVTGSSEHLILEAKEF